MESHKTALLVNKKAAKQYADAVAQLAKNIATVSRDDYDSLRVASEKARRLSMEALEAVDAHAPMNTGARFQLNPQALPIEQSPAAPLLI